MSTATLSSGLVAETADRQEKRRRAISGAVFSEFIDMFDIYLPTVVLSPVLFYFQPARLDPGEQAIFASLVFITTLLGRRSGRSRLVLWRTASGGAWRPSPRSPALASSRS